MALFDDTLAEIRSVLNAKRGTGPISVDHEALRTHYEALWSSDRERTEQEVDPYVSSSLEAGDAFPSLYFEQYGSEPMPREWHPLFNHKRLEEAPYTKFVRSLGYAAVWRDYAPGFDYESDDPYRSSEPRYWMPWEDLPWSPVARQFTSLTLDFEGLCEGRDEWNDQYIEPYVVPGMLFKFTSLEKFAVRCGKYLIDEQSEGWTAFLTGEGFDPDKYIASDDPFNQLSWEEQDAVFDNLTHGRYDTRLRELDLRDCLLDADENAWVTALNQQRFSNLTKLTLSMRKEAPRQKLIAAAKAKKIKLQINDFYVPPHASV